MKEILNKTAFVILLVILLITFTPWTADILFNTKGEPREAIVALSMIQNDNWILPVTFGEEIPYKPPFLAWCICILSKISGNLTEFTSRLPSIIAAIGLILSTFVFFRRHKSSNIGLLTSLITLTTVEVWRGAWACRVDMLLTAFTVCAIYSMYNFFDRNKRGLPIAAIALMTCAVLTKGPVGMLLPCLTIGIFRLLRGDRFIPIFVKLCLSGLLACVIPTIWYVMAYRIGGDAFLQLVVEENFGRFLGKMGYESHENPFYYNFITVITGMLPYTILCLIGVCGISFANGKSIWPTLLHRLRDVRTKLRNADPVNVFAITVTLVIFVFYCFPKSKRSVYLLPIYPFLSYFITLSIKYMIKNFHKPLKIYGCIMASATALISLVVIAINIDSIFSIGFDWPQSLSHTVEAINYWGGSLRGVTFLILALAAAIYTYASARNNDMSRIVRGTIACILTSYWITGTVFMPAILNAKSDKIVAMALEANSTDGPLYYFIDDNLLRYYTANFYTDDRMRPFDKTMPNDGLMAISKPDLDVWNKTYGSLYETKLVNDIDHKSCDRRQPMVIIEFHRK